MPSPIRPDRPAVCVSYPKSGRTLLRFMLWEYYRRLNQLTLDNLCDADDIMLKRCGLTWGHYGGNFKYPYWQMNDFDRATLHAADRVFFIHRNAYQTLNSTYYWLKHRTLEFRGSVAEFLRHPRFGVVKLATFYRLWHADWSSLCPNCLTFSYDELANRRADSLRRAVTFLGFDVDQGRIDEVAHMASFDQMQRLGDRPEYLGTPIGRTVADDPASRKVRSGNPVEYLATFTDDERAYIARVLGALLPDDLPIRDELTRDVAAPALLTAAG